MSNEPPHHPPIPSAQPLPTQFGAISTREPAYADELKEAKQYAQGDGNLLIQGESGTGKELMARAIHAHSSRSAQPCVTLNCAAIAATLLHSELFGHARGAFTGATEARAGALASAHGGTLFLDEIGDAPITVQVALLRALESKCIKPLGQETERAVDVRVIAATSRPLTHLMRSTEFRADLYFRLASAVISLAPLRERGRDLEDLANRLLVEQQRDGGKPPRLHPAALEALKSYSWPGNVRELSNVLSRAACLIDESECGGRPWIGPQHLGLPHDEPAPPEPRSAVRQTAKAGTELEGLDYLLPEAQRYAQTGILLLPPGLSRRGVRAYERALLLVLQEHDIPWPPQLVTRAYSLLKKGWQGSDRGQALRDVLKLCKPGCLPGLAQKFQR